MVREDSNDITYSIINSQILDNNSINGGNSGKKRHITLYNVKTEHNKLEIIIPGFLFYNWKHNQILRNIDSNIAQNNVHDLKDYILVNYKDKLPKNKITKKQKTQNITQTNTENFANNIIMQISPEMLQKYKKIRIIGISTGCNLVLPILISLIKRVNEYNKNEKEKGVYEQKIISPKIELDFKITPALPKYNSLVGIATGLYKLLLSYKSQPKRLISETSELINRLNTNSDLTEAIINNNITINIAEYINDKSNIIHSKKELPSITALRTCFNELNTIIKQNLNQFKFSIIAPESKNNNLSYINPHPIAYNLNCTNNPINIDN
jgi:hypothetical protein